MKYEKLDINSGSKYKWLLCGLIMGVLLIIIINLIFSYAKYKSVDSVKLASGTINYESADLNVIAMYKNDGDGDISMDTIPAEGNYELSNESYCIVGGNKENKIRDVFEYKDNKVYIAIDQKGTKCYVYFEKVKTPSEKTLANLNLKSLGKASRFDDIACSGCAIDVNGVYEADDDYGTSYYFRGSVSNNWVKFGKKGSNDIYWRIIRINGNGTIRLIYAGETGSLGSSSTGKNAVDSKAYNSSYDDNKYVGFMYGSVSTPTEKYGDAHKNEIKSDILNELETWWGTTNLGDLLGKIDGATGFCNDRQSYNGSSSTSTPDISTKGYGKVETYYGPSIRAYQTFQPTFKCALKSQDLFTLSTDRGDGNGALDKPIGLITADEVMYAGDCTGKVNNGYWLYTNQYYWTMSPYSFNGSYAYVFVVLNNGGLNYDRVSYTTLGVRPVINLKANTKFKTTDGLDGTYQHPYEVA